MKRSITRWTTTLVAAALLGLPAGAWAQTSTPTPQPPAATTSQQSDPAQANSPQEHLRQAKEALTGIQSTSIPARSRAQFAELTRHVNNLEKLSAAASGASAATGNTSGTAAKGTRAQTASNNWGTEVAAIDRILTNLIGAEGTTGSASDPTPAAGTSGTTGADSRAGTSAANIDENTRSKLMDVRTHITVYAVAMSGQSTLSADQSGSAGAAGTAGSPATGTIGSGVGTTGSMSSTETHQTGTQAAQPQINPEEARRDLTAARETLAQLTQLPQAAALSGEARAQISQLISNFNELITTQTEWRASYAKVEANLDALLGPDNTDAERTGGVPTGTTGAGVAGTAGTSGAATVQVDPAIRERLVQLRSQLNDFKRASGGSQSAEASQQGDQMSRQEALRHIEAIEAILNGNSPAAGTTSSTTGTTGSTTGTTGGTTGSTASGAAGAYASGPVTLDKAQLDQLRMHLNELRRLVSQAGK